MSQPHTNVQPAAPAIDYKSCRWSSTKNSIITPKCRLSYPRLLVAEENKLNPGAGKSYTASLLIPPGCDLKLLKEECKRVATQKWGAALPQGLKLPFLDAGAQKGMADFAGWTLLRVATKETRGRPSCVDAERNPIEPTPDQAYSGRWACVGLKPWCYDKAGNRGVSLGLQVIQLLDHDEPLAGSRMSAEDEFAPIESASGGVATSADDIFA